MSRNVVVSVLEALCEAEAPLTSSALCGLHPSRPPAETKGLLAGLKQDGLVEVSRGRGFAPTEAGRQALARLQTEGRIEELELRISTLEEISSLIPRAADPTVTAAELQAAMMDLDPVDRELYDRLRAARNAVASALGISPYQLGQNRALRMLTDMQVRQPTQALSEEDVVGIVPGMTPKTWGRVGQTLQAVCSSWVTQQQRLSQSDSHRLRHWEIPR